MQNSEKQILTQQIPTRHIGKRPVVSVMSNWLGGPDSHEIRLGHGFSVTAEKKLNAHEHLYLDGDRQTRIYEILEGVIGVYKMLPDGRRQFVSFHFPGDILGLLSAETFVDHAEALSDAKVRCIPVEAVASLLTSEPAFGKAMLRLLSSELSATREQLLSLGRKTAMEKLASFLLSVARRNDVFGVSSTILHLPITRAEMADYLGLTVETVSRKFTQLKLSSIIKILPNSEIEILNASALEKIAEGE